MDPNVLLPAVLVDGEAAVTIQQLVGRPHPGELLNVGVWAATNSSAPRPRAVQLRLRRRRMDRPTPVALGTLIEFPRVAARPSWSLAGIHEASGMTDEEFGDVLAEELGWPGMSAAVLRALEAGCAKPTPDVLAAAERVLAMAITAGRRTSSSDAPAWPPPAVRARRSAS
jgi:hypothetical protein